MSEGDVTGDVQPVGDVTNAAGSMRAGLIRFGLTMPTTPDPTTDPSWQLGETFTAWLVDVLVDEQRITQVLTNLLGNALTYTPAGGRVTATARHTGATSTPAPLAPDATLTLTLPITTTTQ